AQCADRMILLRSLVGLIDEHSSFQNVAGFPMNQTQREGKPHFGAIVAKTQGPVDPVVPPFVDLFPTMQHKPYNSPAPGLLGRAAAPARLDGQDLQTMKLQAITLEELSDRRRLLEQLDAQRTGAERAGMDASYERAFDVLASSKLVDALDVTKEPDRVRERY